MPMSRETEPGAPFRRFRLLVELEAELRRDSAPLEWLHHCISDARIFAGRGGEVEKDTHRR